MEFYDQGYGCILYSTTVPAGRQQSLRVTEVHDWATVFLDGKRVGTLDRRNGEHSLRLPNRRETGQARHPRRGDGPRELRAIHARPQGHYRESGTDRRRPGHAPRSLEGLQPAARCRHAGRLQFSPANAHARGRPSGAARSPSSSRATPFSTCALGERSGLGQRPLPGPLLADRPHADHVPARLLAETRQRTRSWFSTWKPPRKPVVAGLAKPILDEVRRAESR